MEKLPSTAWFELADVFEARYQLGPVALCVDVRNGRLFKLIPGAGYMGSLWGAIHVGMSIADAMRLDARLYYDEAEEFVLIRDVPGVALDVPAIDPSPALVPRMTVSAISVFAQEIMTAAGQEGRW